jgi:hypothetical protein
MEERFGAKYIRVSMPLIDVVSGDFFNQYIKTGTFLETIYLVKVGLISFKEIF